MSLKLHSGGSLSNKIKEFYIFCAVVSNLCAGLKKKSKKIELFYYFILPKFMGLWFYLRMLTHRSQQKELLDLGRDYYTEQEYKDCLLKLFKVNQFLGIYKDTVVTLKQFSNSSSLLDIGCGGGLFLIHLSKVFPELQMLGIDISSEAIQEANTNLLNSKLNAKINFQLLANPKLDFAENSFDLILATLVCHHLSDQELIVFFQKTYKMVKNAVIVNDLQRHSLAHLLFAMFSPLLFRNRLITHDGLISIKRGFTRAELDSLIQQAGIKNYKIKWRFPFRWQIIIYK